MVKVFFKRAAHLLTAFFAGGVCVLQAAETSGFGIDLGNGSGAAQEGWTNVTMPATASGGANTFVAVPLIRNGAASSSSSVAVGSLFGSAGFPDRLRQMQFWRFLYAGGTQYPVYLV